MSFEEGESTAADAAQEFLARRGSQPRIHKNTLVFLAADVDRVDTLESVLRRKMAWKWVKEHVRELNLDQHNITVVEDRLGSATQAVSDTIRETYKWIILPYQEAGSAEVELARSAGVSSATPTALQDLRSHRSVFG